VLSIRERVKDEVWGEAVAESKKEVVSQVTELEEKGLDPAEILKQLKNLLITAPNTSKNNV